MTKKTTKKRATKVVKENFVDWHKLCVQLQEALAQEMRENQDLQQHIEELTIEIYKHQGAITYLECKLNANRNNQV